MTSHDQSPDRGQPKTGRPNQSSSSHPDERFLALYSRKDLGWRDQFMLARHVKSCAQCTSAVERFQVATVDFQREAAAGTLTGFEAIADWNALEGEMLGNIRVGLDASRCIDHVGRRGFAGWRVAMVVLALLMVFCLGWMLNTPRQQTEWLLTRLQSMAGQKSIGSPIVSTTPLGITVRSQGGTMTLLSPSSNPVSVTLSGASVVSASYVDAETGQVTITNVYGQ
jgi:hypothetical protein